MVQSHRDLRIWRQAIEFAPEIYEVVNCLPAEEKYAIGDQMRRAVVSISANIAEGYARQHTKEFIQFLTIARGSLAELDSLCEICLRVGYIGPETNTRLQQRVSALRAPINVLIQRLRGAKAQQR